MRESLWDEKLNFGWMVDGRRLEARAFRLHLGVAITLMGEPIIYLKSIYITRPRIPSLFCLFTASNLFQKGCTQHSGHVQSYSLHSYTRTLVNSNFCTTEIRERLPHHPSDRCNSMFHFPSSAVRISPSPPSHSIWMTRMLHLFGEQRPPNPTPT